ncbi:MAG: AAA family ATPase, partial [Anaerolineae bacterium]
MSLDRLALNQVAHPAKRLTEKSGEPRLAKPPAEWSGDRRRSALAFVRRGADAWRDFRVLERGVLEGALALTREGRGQTLFVALHGPRAFADRRIDTIEVKAFDPNRPFGLVRDLLRAALARPDARSAASTLPAKFTAALKNPSETCEADRSTWTSTVTDFFARLSARKPLMIILDHVHRADAGSLDVFDALAQAVSTSRILLLVTYRIDAPPNPQLDRVMRSLLDAGLARSAVVAGPHADEARLLFQSAFGRSMRPEAAASIADDEPAVLM